MPLCNIVYYRSTTALNFRRVLSYALNPFCDYKKRGLMRQPFFGICVFYCQNPENAIVELPWSLLGMRGRGLHSHTRLVGQGIPPERISFAWVWHAYRRAMRGYKSSPDPGERLHQLIDRALIDSDI